MAVIAAAAVPVLTAYIFVFVRKACDNAASTSQEAQNLLEASYGGIQEYLTTRIEAEVRKQKSAVTALALTR